MSVDEAIQVLNDLIIESYQDPNELLAWEIIKKNLKKG